MAKIKVKMLPIIPSVKFGLDQLDWVSAKLYELKECVTSDNNLYVCIEAHTSDTVFDNTKFKLITKGTLTSTKLVREEVVTVVDTVVNLPVNASGITEPYVLKQTEINTWAKAYEDRSYIEETDYSVVFNEGLTTMTITFLATGNYKIFY